MKLRAPQSPQTDLFRHSPAPLAAAYREAAAAARVNPYFTEAERAERAAYYEAEARRIECLP